MSDSNSEKTAPRLGGPGLDREVTGPVQELKPAPRVGHGAATQYGVLRLK